MSNWTAIRLVAEREVRERGRSKAFIVSTAVSVVILAAIVVIASTVAGDDDRPSFDVGTVGERPAEVAAVAVDLAGGDADLDVREVRDEAEADRLVEAGDLDAALVDDRLVVGDEPSAQLAALLQAANREVALATVLDEAGATPEQVAAAAPDPLHTDAVDPDDDSGERKGVAVVGTMLLYFQLFGYGYWVASGIVEEKASRVVELLLAKTRARPLLAGKLLGIGLMGFAQLALFVGVGLGLTLALGGVDLPAGTAGVAAALLGWFVLGYALYSCLFAMGGAIASRSEELQSTTTPITIAILAAYFASFQAVENPEGTLAVVTGLVPFTAPMVMPVRMATDAVAPWELALSVAILVTTIVLLVRLAARVYAGGILFTRGKIKLGEALARAEA